VELSERFAITDRDLGACGSPDALAQRLLAAWDEPERAYHDREHLRSCLELFDELRDLAQRPAEVEMAIWFHDAVYDVRALDNEERSARWAQRELHPIVGEEVAARVAELVRSTKHATGLEPRGDARVLSDVDLAVLRFPPDEFDSYERAVRREYAWVEEAQWRAARSAVLSELLARETLFHTVPMRARFEVPARQNLRRALAELCDG
jgi:predicted metal-dependent HD superfamily phosphohydrolase